MIQNNSSGIVVVSVPNRTSPAVTPISNSSDPSQIATEIHNSYPYPDEKVLDDIYTRFGGLEAFTVKSLTPQMKYLRNTLMGSKNFPIRDFIAIFDSTPKIGREDANSYASQDYFLTDVDKFSRVWSANRTEALRPISSYDRLSPSSYYSAWETLPTIHAEDCRGDEPGNLLAHFTCEKPKIFHADLHLNLLMDTKQKLENTVHPKIIDFIHEYILDCAPVQRALYAESLIVRSDHWEKLSQDSNRNVLNNVVSNALLPTNVADEIIATHKTPVLRESIARYSVNNDLLNRIWRGTKSARIRKVVEQNSMFTLQ